MIRAVAALIAVALAAPAVAADRKCQAGAVCRSTHVDWLAAAKVHRACPRASIADVSDSINSQEVNEGPFAADEVDLLASGARLFVDCRN